MGVLEADFILEHKYQDLKYRVAENSLTKETIQRNCERAIHVEEKISQDLQELDLKRKSIEENKNDSEDKNKTNKDIFQDDYELESERQHINEEIKKIEEIVMDEIDLLSKLKEERNKIDKSLDEINQADSLLNNSYRLMAQERDGIISINSEASTGYEKLREEY